MSVNSKKKFIGARCLAVITTLAQDDFDRVHKDYIEYVMLHEGATIVRR